jgi:hypothetical protein
VFEINPFKTERFQPSHASLRLTCPDVKGYIVIMIKRIISAFCEMNIKGGSIYPDQMMMRFCNQERNIRLQVFIRNSTNRRDAE